MLVGLKNNSFLSPKKLKPGDFVYVCCYLDVARYAYHSATIDSGYGVVVEASYNEGYPEYLLESTLIGVYINGKVNWYSPHEILRVKGGDVSTDP